ncbi:hypothetical protein, partial [Shewanella sp. MF08487]|uniref:hypothetical protein n=1 Tax=Shewanella sp. MF08487 TaxID=3434873 RepID=UPI003D79E59B
MYRFDFTLHDEHYGGGSRKDKASILADKYTISAKLQTQKSQLIQLASLHLIEIIRRLAMTYSHMGRPHTTI